MKFVSRYLFSREKAMLSCGTFFFCLIIAAGWYLSDYLGKNALTDIIASSKGETSMLVSQVGSELLKYHREVLLFAEKPELPDYFFHPTKENASLINNALDRHVSTLKLNVEYLMDTNGNVIASSNRNAPDSFLGRNFAVRPYFKTAMAGKQGSWLGLGSVSRKMGFYASAPVYGRDRRIIGVAVVKQSLESLSDSLSGIPLCFAVDHTGMLLFSATKEPFQKSLWPLSEQEQKEISREGRFGSAPFSPVLPARINDGALIKFNGLEYYASVRPVQGEDFSIVLCKSTEKLMLYRLSGIGAAILAGLLMLVFMLLGKLTALKTNETAKYAKQLDMILRASPDATFVIDRKGKVLVWNKAIEEMTGIKAADMLGRSNYEYAIPFYGKRHPILIDIAMSPGLPERQDYATMEKYGRNNILSAESLRLKVKGKNSYIWATAAALFDENGKITGAVECLRDITNQKYQEQLIRTFAGELIKLHNATSAISMADSTEELSARVSKTLLTMSGLDLCWFAARTQNGKALRLSDAPGLIPNPAQSTITTEELDAQNFVTTAMETKLPQMVNDSSSSLADPVATHAFKCGYISCAAYPIVENGVINGLLTLYSKEKNHFTQENLSLYSIFVNQVAVSLEKVHLIESLEKTVMERTLKLQMETQNAKQARIQAEAADKAKSVFLANMSHELRTPLNIILVSSQVLGAEMLGNLNEQQKNYISNIRESGTHLLSLISDVLNLSKIEAGKLQLDIMPCELSPLLEEIAASLKETAKSSGVELDMQCLMSDSPTVEFDARKVKQILLNLISNAIKFSPQGGRVLLNARKADMDYLRRTRPELVKELDELNGANMDYVQLSVCDSGIGIKPEDMGNLFKAFSQVESTNNRQFEGTGLGLILSKRMVELHRGRVWMKSEPGKGCEVFFVLPLKTAKTKAA